MTPVVAGAQVFRNVSVEKLSGSEPGDVRMAGISSDGQYAFVTSQTSQGLQRVSLKDGSRKLITKDSGAGIQPVISEDGRMVLFTSDHFDENHLRHTSVSVKDLASDSETQLIQPVRDLRSYRFAGSQAVVESADDVVRRKVRSLPQTIGQDEKEAEQSISVSNTGLRLQLTVGGKTTVLTPNGDDEDTNYIWASLSPDRKRILYYVSDEGAYVCNLQGEDVQYIGVDCLAPQWYDDNTIIGMKNTDDGHFILTSVIEAYTLDGARQQLTEPSQMLMYPYCSAATHRIVCTAANGEIFTINTEK